MGVDTPAPRRQITTDHTFFSLKFADQVIQNTGGRTESATICLSTRTLRNIIASHGPPDSTHCNDSSTPHRTGA